MLDRAAKLAGDADFLQAAELFTQNPSFDLTRLVSDLVTAEAVPFLAAYRYQPSGLRHREIWEKTWELQRREDAIDACANLPTGLPQYLTAAQAAARKATEIGTIPVPPKYGSGDFRKTAYWALRGKLDVPKERFIGYPGAERGVDPTPVIGWAGWSYLQRAQALAGYYIRMKEQEGFSAKKLTPLLAGLRELVLWLRQWHNEIDPAYGVGMGGLLQRIRLRRGPRPPPERRVAGKLDTLSVVRKNRGSR
ncbi:MAG: hypothetical protein HYV63_08310 [Candidatus Schekmanbacteria bacterium]|nr:hypothetical protein [Candidatus Schekmanbacteria bacterium]